MFFFSMLLNFNSTKVEKNNKNLMQYLLNKCTGRTCFRYNTYRGSMWSWSPSVGLVIDTTHTEGLRGVDPLLSEVGAGL